MSPGERSPRSFRYRKLPGDFRGFFRRHTLWLGPDHLLSVASSRFSETYQRFYLNDIQTIIIRKTPRFVLPYYWILLVAVAFLAFLLAAEYPTLRPDGVGWLGLAVLTAVFVYLYVVSVFQSCTCHLITRVNRVELSSLFRLRAARRFVRLVTPRIIDAQGQMPEGWIERTTTLAELSTAADRNPDTLVDPLPTGTFTWLAVFVFVLVLADGGLTWLQLHSPNSRSLSTPNVINVIALVVCATISIVRLSRQKGGPFLRIMVLAALLVVGGASYGAVLLQSFDQQFYQRTFPNVLDYPGMRNLAIGEIIFDMIVAVPGLFLAFRQPQTPPKPTSIFDPGVPPA